MEVRPGLGLRGASIHPGLCQSRDWQTNNGRNLFRLQEALAAW